MSTDGTHRLDTDALAEVEISEQSDPSLDEPPPRSSKRKPLVIGAVVAGLLLGAVASVAWWQRNDARQQLAAVEKQKRDLEDALELHRTSKLKLDTELSTCKEERKVEKQTVEKQLTQVEMSLQVCKEAKSGLEDQTQEVQQRMAELDRLTDRFRQMVDTGDLSVQLRRGQMVVELPSAVLFASGKADLSERGVKTLTRVAEVLRTLPRRKFTVAGHTDSRPLRKSQFANNWELSSARAVQVTMQLIEAGVKPKNLIAAGYGPYAPVATNRSARGRQLNRRIEIILEPDLAKLPKKALANTSGSKRARKK